MLTAALLLATNEADPDTELLISENMIASVAELNYYGICLYFMTVGGNL